ncbi:MAG: hypothetical protein AB1730_09395 [Myxococcota bacterium]
MKRRIAVVVVALCGIFLAAGVAGGAVLASTATERRREMSRQLSEQYERHRAHIDRDEARWATDPLLAPGVGGDAARLFAEHVGWERTDGGIPGPRAPLPTTVVERLKAATGRAWLDLEDPEVLSIDVGWLSRLEAFGSWDIEGEESPLAAIPFDPLTEPLPDFTALQTFAKVRLLQGLEQGDVVRAAAEVRHLARLAYSTEHLVGAATAVSLLGLERRAHAAALERELDVSGWTPVSEEDADGLRAVLWAANAVTSLLAEGPLAARPLRVGECPALREGLGQAHALRALLEDELPDRYAALDRALANSSCRLRRLRRAWTARSSDGQFPATTKIFCVDGPGLICDAPRVPLRWVPFSRTIIGGTVVAVTTPNWFEDYERRAPAHEAPETRAP